MGSIDQTKAMRILVALAAEELTAGIVSLMRMSPLKRGPLDGTFLEMDS